MQKRKYARPGGIGSMEDMVVTSMTSYSMPLEMLQDCGSLFLPRSLAKCGESLSHLGGILHLTWLQPNLAVLRCAQSAIALAQLCSLGTALLHVHDHPVCLMLAFSRRLRVVSPQEPSLPGRAHPDLSKASSLQHSPTDSNRMSSTRAAETQVWKRVSGSSRLSRLLP